MVQFVDSGNRLVDGVMRETGGARSQSKREATKWVAPPPRCPGARRSCAAPQALITPHLP